MAQIHRAHGPEHVALLAAARARPAPAALEQLRLLSRGPLDWDLLSRLSDAHGVGPLVAVQLAAAGVAVSEATAERSTQQLIENTAVNLSLTAQLDAVLKLLAAHGIPAIAYKGPALAAGAYGHIGLRRFFDLDILVAAREHATRARALMVEAGYQRAESYSIVDGVHPAAGREYALVPTETGLVTVEIQVAVTSWALPVNLDPADLIARAVTVDVAGARIKTVCPEDLLLVLAAHGFSHEWSSLRFIADIDAAATAGVDWRVVTERARAARMRRMLRVALLLSHAVLETDIPAHVLAEATCDRGARRLAAQIEARLFAPRRVAFGHVWTDWVSLQSRERLADKLTYVWRKTLFERVIRPADEWKSVRVNAASWIAGKLARRLAIPLLGLALWVATWTSRPMLVGGGLCVVVIAAYLAVARWTTRAVPVRSWASLD